MNWLSNLFGGIGKAISGGAGKVASLGQQGFAKAAPRMGAMTQLGMQPAAKNAGFAPAMSTPQSFNSGGGFLDQMFKGVNMPQMAMGGGINLLGQFMAPKVKTPDIQSSPNIQALQNFQYNKMPANAEEAINRSLDIQNEEQMRNLRNVYKNVRPGTDYTTDSAYQRDLANLQRSQTINRADALAGEQLQYAQADQQRMMELANADLTQIMLETGMNIREAEQFKKSFSNVGSMFMQNSMPKNSVLNSSSNKEEDNNWLGNILAMFK